jgi:hypothetical protein
MPSTNLAIGPLDLPVPASAADVAIHDPVVRGLADYFRHWLRDGLNGALSNLLGTASDAVPADNVFYWEPASYFTRGRGDGAASPVPSLFVWRMGSKTVRTSITDVLRRSQIGVCWIFDELTLPAAWEDRYGLCPAADALLMAACERAYHPSYGYNGDAIGTSIAVSLKLAGTYPWLDYEGGQAGMLSPVPQALQAQIRGADQPVVHAFPCIRASLVIHERIGDFLPLDPDEVGRDIQTTIAVGSSDATGSVEVLSGVLPGGPAPEDT